MFLNQETGRNAAGVGLLRRNAAHLGLAELCLSEDADRRQQPGSVVCSVCPEWQVCAGLHAGQHHAPLVAQRRQESEGAAVVWSWCFLTRFSHKQTYSGHTNKKYCIFSCFGVDHDLGRNYVLSGSEDNNAYIWDLQTKVFPLSSSVTFFFCVICCFVQEVLQVLQGHTSPVVGVDYHPEKNIIATCSFNDDPSVRLWTSKVDP